MKLFAILILVGVTIAWAAPCAFDSLYKRFGLKQANLYCSIMVCIGGACVVSAILWFTFLLTTGRL